MLNVQNLSLRYGAALALRDVSLEARAGEVTCVLGRNGVGKSSLLRGIVGHRPIASGSITFGGREISRLKPYERALRQDRALVQARDLHAEVAHEGHVVLDHHDGAGLGDLA